MTDSVGTLKESFKEPACLPLLKESLSDLRRRFLRRKRPLEAVCIRLILFYQNHLSRHTCLYEPTCSEYTKRCIHNHGVLFGICLGLWRILRCNPFSSGGFDPAPERRSKRRWLI